MSVYAAVDVGGTNLKFGAVSGVDVIVGPLISAHAQGDRATIVRQVQAAVDGALTCAGEFESVGPAGVVLAFPGPFDLDEATPRIRGLEKFEAIYGVDLRTELTVGPRLPIVFVRDSEAVGVGEALCGAGRGASRVLTVALGTGLGSCLTVDGRPVRAHGAQVIDQLHRLSTPEGRADDVLCARGLAGLLEVDPEHVAAAFTARPIRSALGDAIEEFGRRLAAFLDRLRWIGIDRVVVAGGLSQSFDRFAPAIAQHLDIPCVAAELGARGPLLGAVRLAFSDEQQDAR